VSDVGIALTVPCPGCKMPADAACVDLETGAKVEGVHQNRVYRAYVVAEADAHNRAVELAAEVERLKTRLADFEALARAAIHYVNCPDREAETGEPYDALIHVVRVHERNEERVKS